MTTERIVELADVYFSEGRSFKPAEKREILGFLEWLTESDEWENEQEALALLTGQDYKTK